MRPQTVFIVPGQAFELGKTIAGVVVLLQKDEEPLLMRSIEAVLRRKFHRL